MANSFFLWRPGFPYDALTKKELQALLEFVKECYPIELPRLASTQFCSSTGLSSMRAASSSKQPWRTILQEKEMTGFSQRNKTPKGNGILRGVSHEGGKAGRKQRTLVQIG
jgi:hypothetical protein